MQDEEKEDGSLGSLAGHISSDSEGMSPSEGGGQRTKRNSDSNSNNNSNKGNKSNNSSNNNKNKNSNKSKRQKDKDKGNYKDKDYKDKDKKGGGSLLPPGARWGLQLQLRVDKPNGADEDSDLLSEDGSIGTFDNNSEGSDRSDGSYYRDRDRDREDGAFAFGGLESSADDSSGSSTEEGRFATYSTACDCWSVGATLHYVITFSEFDVAMHDKISLPLPTAAAVATAVVTVDSEQDAVSASASVSDTDKTKSGSPVDIPAGAGAGINQHQSEAEHSPESAFRAHCQEITRAVSGNANLTYVPRRSRRGDILGVKNQESPRGTSWAELLSRSETNTSTNTNTSRKGTPPAGKTEGAKLAGVRVEDYTAKNIDNEDIDKSKNNNNNNNNKFKNNKEEDGDGDGDLAPLQPGEVEWEQTPFHLIWRLTDKYPETRLTLKEAISHPWLLCHNLGFRGGLQEVEQDERRVKNRDSIMEYGREILDNEHQHSISMEAELAEERERAWTSHVRSKGNDTYSRISKSSRHSNSRYSASNDGDGRRDEFDKYLPQNYNHHNNHSHHNLTHSVTGSSMPMSYRDRLLAQTHSAHTHRSGMSQRGDFDSRAQRMAGGGAQTPYADMVLRTAVSAENLGDSGKKSRSSQGGDIMNKNNDHALEDKQADVFLATTAAYEDLAKQNLEKDILYALGRKSHSHGQNSSGSGSGKKRHTPGSGTGTGTGGGGGGSSGNNRHGGGSDLTEQNLHDRLILPSLPRTSNNNPTMLTESVSVNSNSPSYSINNMSNNPCSYLGSSGQSLLPLNSDQGSAVSYVPSQPYALTRSESMLSAISSQSGSSSHPQVS